MSRARDHVRPVGAGGELAAPAETPRPVPEIGDVWATRGAHCSAWDGTAGALEVQVDLERQTDGHQLVIDITTGGIDKDGRTWHAKDSMTIPARCIEALLAALTGAHAEGTRNGMFPAEPTVGEERATCGTEPGGAE